MVATVYAESVHIEIVLHLDRKAAGIEASTEAEHKVLRACFLAASLPCFAPHSSHALTAEWTQQA